MGIKVNLLASDFGDEYLDPSASPIAKGLARHYKTKPKIKVGGFHVFVGSQKILRIERVVLNNELVDSLCFGPTAFKRIKAKLNKDPEAKAYVILQRVEHLSY